MKNCILILAAVLVCILLPNTSFAHSVYIFAWLDGAQICTESYFTQSNKVRGGKVFMADAAGSILAHGVTGEDGLLCFPSPSTIQPLEFTVNAGAGHRGSFKLEQKEIADASNVKEAVGQSASTVQPQGPRPEREQPAVQTANAHSADNTAVFRLDAGSEELMRRIVQEELQKQFSPIRQYLAENLENKTPGIREIVGGIGWLAGLGALGFWYSQRRKKP